MNIPATYATLNADSARILLNNDPFDYRAPVTITSDGMIRTWPAKWVQTPFPAPTSTQVAFRCQFTIAEACSTRVHISADERYQLFLDGKPLGRGPDLGDQENWYYDSYQLSFAAGAHVLVARVLMLGEHRPTPQISLAHGLLLCTDPASPLLPLLATGVAPWTCKLLTGVTIGGHVWSLQATGPMTLDAHDFPWGYETGEGDDWVEAIPLQDASIAAEAMEYSRTMHLLRPAVLPPQLDRVISGVSLRQVRELSDFDDDAQPFSSNTNLPAEQAAWSAGEVTIPAHSLRRVLLQFDDYYSFYYSIVLSGGRGARLRIASAERLFGPKITEPLWESKAMHDVIDGAYFDGPHDQFTLDGGTDRLLTPFWWRCGRYVQIVVMTDEEALTITNLTFHETRYPLEMQSSFTVDDAQFAQILPICFRTLQQCCHDIYVDCPFYEQTQWVGDMRVQLLCHYVTTGDVRQIKKALSLIDNSASLGGFVRAYYPSDNRLLIPGFALWHIASVHDLALWRGEVEFIQTLMPQARATMDAILQNMRADGLLAWPQGWPFTDWASGFPNGDPPAGESRTESIFNFQAVHVLDLLANLEEYLGEDDLAARWRRKAKALATASNQAFWDSARGLFAIDLDHQYFAEHSQCMALLSERITPLQQQSIADALLSDTSITPVQIFYSHYLFEAYRKVGRMDALFTRLDPWREMLAMGLKTATETAPHTRSDCHAWSSHPLYHYFTTILGIRPASMGFATVTISPQLGLLEHASGKLIHPAGFIEVDFQQHAGVTTGSITLPVGITGTVQLAGNSIPLHSGKQQI